MKTPRNFLAVLPQFPGFYDSNLSDLIDQEMEQRMEQEGLTFEQVEPKYSFALAQTAITKAWVHAFSVESGLKMEYESIVSPKEYNFSTDKCYVLLPLATLKKLKTIRNTPEFAEQLKNHCTSYDGFISFYSNDVNDAEWKKDIKDFDHNQLSLLIAAYVECNYDDGLQGLIMNILDCSHVYESVNAMWIA